MAIQVWDPFRDMRQVEDNINRLWRGMGNIPVYHAGSEDWNILMDVIQKPEELEVKASMPGVNPENIDITIEDNVLTIKAERKAETEVKDAAYLIRERASGSFFRALHLPESVDTNKVKSSYENGVLVITLPKAEEKKRKQIKVSVSDAARTIEAARKS